LILTGKRALYKNNRRSFIGTGLVFPEKSKELFKEKARLENVVLPFELLEQKLLYIEESIGILDEEGGEMFVKEIRNEMVSFKNELELIELQTLLSGELDRNNAILTIHSGAGGTESQDWAQMLMRMYLRWAERRGYQAQIVDTQPGEEAGIKNATVTIHGDYAYGYLRSEAGVHRLVRISLLTRTREGTHPLHLSL